MSDVLRPADEQALAEAVASTGRSAEVLKAAAAFFIEQVLLVPKADSYRILGLPPTAGSAELRMHMALLMKWLHPDVDGVGQKAMFAGLVTRAWEDLKTAERRQAYDAALLLAPSAANKPTPRRHKSSSSQRERSRRPGLVIRTLARLLKRAEPLR